MPAGVRAAISEALSKDPAARPRDAHAFAAQLRRLQLAGMPPPERPPEVESKADEPTRLTEMSDVVPPTQVMGTDGDGSRTAVMPPGSIVARAPDLGLSQEPYASRRRRRGIGVAVVAAVLIVVGMSQVGGGSEVPLLVPTTTGPATGPVPTAPVVTLVVDNPTPTSTTTTVDNKPGKGKGKGNGKPKG